MQVIHKLAGEFMDIQTDKLKKLREEIANRKKEEEKKQNEAKQKRENETRESTSSSMENEIKALIEKIQQEDTPFAQFVPEVKPIKNNAVILKKGSQLSEEQIQIRKISASTEKVTTLNNNFSLEHIKFLDPFEVTGFYKDGVQRGVYLKVKNAEYQIKDYLDLHNHTLEKACTAVDRFLEKSFQRGLRFVIIIHGKGEYTKPPAFLKSYVFTWLKESPNVLAAHHAMPYHGGPGATYVLIKKNDALKADNREIYSSR